MACFVYDIYFRMATFYGPSDFINVSSIIFIVNIILLAAGVAYYACKSWTARGDLLYTTFFLLLLGFCIWKTAGIQRFADYRLNHEFIQLLGGRIICIVIAVICVPVFYKNKKIVNFFYEAII